MAGTPMPCPVPNEDSREYWEGCQRQELLIQRCKACGAFRHPPRPGCHKCGSLDKEWAKSSGKGLVYSYTIIPFSIHPATDDKVPYNVMLVELPDVGNIRLVSNLVGCENHAIHIGMAVEIVWEALSEEIMLPKFKPAAVAPPRLEGARNV